MEIQIINNTDNSLNMNITTNERTIRLNSSRPYAEAQKTFSQLSTETSSYFIGGLGLGYLLEQILENTQNKDCIIFEPQSEIFDQCLEVKPKLKELLKDSRVIFVQTLEELANVLDQMMIKDTAFTVHRTYGEIFPDMMIQAQDLIAQAIRKNQISNATLIRFGKLWAKNIFKNIHRYFTSQRLVDCIGIGANKPAIIIGAGPSLQESIPYLKQHAQDAYYIACDTALPILEKNKIPIDFVITVDPQEKNSLYLRHCQNKNHYLIADPGVHSSVFENYPEDRIILMDSSFPFYPYFQQFWGDFGLLASGGSVSTSAFNFAHQIQADPIIMVGQDLAFTQKNTHSSGNVLYQFNYSVYNRLNTYHSLHSKITYPQHGVYIQGRHAQTMVQADARFVLYRDWFSQEIQRQSAKVIIAGLEGAFINGAEHSSIPEAFKKLKPIQKSTILSSKSQQEQDFFNFIKELRDSITSVLQHANISLVQIKKSVASNNLNQAVTETIKLQKNLANSSNQALSGIISISIQSTIQKILEIPDNISDHERLKSIDTLCSEIVISLKDLSRSLKKISTKKIS